MIFAVLMMITFAPVVPGRISAQEIDCLSGIHEFGPYRMCSRTIRVDATPSDVHFIIIIQNSETGEPVSDAAVQILARY